MATMKDKYPNLPGHLTEFKDGGLQLIQEVNPPKTESILILGTAIDGPVMEPVRVDASTYEAVFGKATDDRGIPNGSTAALAFEEAYSAGCRDIRIMRISGTAATAIVKCEETTRITDKVFEGILGFAGGNAEVNSEAYLSSKAQSIISVEADGAALQPSEYRFTVDKTVDGVLTDGTELYDETSVELEEVHYDPLTKRIVVQCVEDIYAHNDDEGDFKFESELPLDDITSEPDTTNYTLVAQKEIDWMYKDYTCGADAYVPGTKESSFVSTTGKVVQGSTAILVPYITSQVAIRDNKVNAGALIKVTYMTADGKKKVENSSKLTPTFVANGADLEFPLLSEEGAPIIPEEGKVRLYIGGAEYSEADTTVEDSTKKVFVIEKGEYEFEGVAEGTVHAKAKIVLRAGKHATRGAKIETRFAYKYEERISPEIKLETAFAGNVYNETQYRVQKIAHVGGLVETVLEIAKPRNKRSQANETHLRYSSFDHPTLALLVRAIGNDMKNAGFVKAYVNDAYAQIETSNLFAEPTLKNFDGGSNGIDLSKQDIFEKLSGKRDASGYLVEQGAYQLLENYTVDYVVPVGVCADDELVGKFDNFAYELALYCAVASHRNHATIGVISTSSPMEPTLKAVEDHVKKLEAYPNLYFMRDAKGDIIRDSEGNGIDLGKYLNVIAGGDVIMNSYRLGQYAVNSAAAFAGYLSQLAINSAPTNKVVKYARGLRIKFSNHQLDRLTNKRYITYKYKGDGQTVAIVDAMTASAPGSDYERTATMRAVRELANEIREVADPFLGEPNTVEQRNALSALLDKRLGQHKEAGTMKDYAFQLIATAYDELVGQATIELTIVPAQELRRITTVISLKPSI